MLLFLDSTNPLEKHHKNNSMKMIPWISAGPVFCSFSFPYSSSNSKERKNSQLQTVLKILRLTLVGKNLY